MPNSWLVLIGALATAAALVFAWEYVSYRLQVRDLERRADEIERILRGDV